MDATTAPPRRRSTRGRFAGRQRSRRELAGLLLEGPRALAEASTLAPSLPLLLSAPRGDGHPVLVLPGFSAGDASTRVLRRYLRSRGYGVHGWLLGRNTGLANGLEGGLAARVEELRERYGRKLSLVGWSMGGVYARELARLEPGSVRQVITLGSPFGASRRPRAAWLYQMVHGEPPAPGFDLLATPPPVPSTAIYSRTDAIVPWRAARERPSPTTDNIEVPGSHVGLGFNPLVLYAVADRLAQPEDEWRPFATSGLRRVVFSKGRDPGA